MAAACLCGAAETKKKSGGSNQSVLTDLRAEIRAVMDDAGLGDKEKKKLAKAGERLSKQIEAAAEGKKIDRGEINKALEDTSDAIRKLPEDRRRAVQLAMARVRDRKLDVEPQQKRAPARQRDPLGYPPGRRVPNPRRWP